MIKDDAGEIIELRCRYDPATRGGSAPDGRRVKATLHWVSARHAIEAEARLYDTLFTVEHPDSDREADFTDFINPNSLTVADPIFVEPSLKQARAGDRFQFERLAYFIADDDSSAEKLVFNRTVTLRDQWRKAQKPARKAPRKRPRKKNRSR